MRSLYIKKFHNFISELQIVAERNAGSMNDYCSFMKK